jgi:hypothetical protein
MELRCYIYESGYPMSVDTDLYPYEVISIVDELESVLNPKGTWDPETQMFTPVDTKDFYAVIPKKHMDYLVIVREGGDNTFPKAFLDKWVTHGRPFYIHPANYGMPPARRVWNQVTVKLVLADDRTLHTTETASSAPA